MGTSRSTAQFVGKIRAAGKKVEADRRRQLTELGVEMKRVAAQRVSSDIGGNTFSGWPKAPIGFEFKMQGDDGLKFGPNSRGKGPLRVAESGRHPGASGPVQGPLQPNVTKSGRLSKRQKSRKRWNGTTRGKSTWTSTVNEFDRVLPPKLAQSITKGIREIFQ